MIIITGAANGIGNYLFKNLKHYDCIGVDKEPIADKDFYCVDISDYELFKETLEPIVHKPIDAVVNCAGICQRQCFQNIFDYDHMYSCNVKTILNTSRLFLPNLTISQGVIINISSIHSVGSLPRYSVYAMTKGAVESLTRALAVELCVHDIRVNCIRLGPVRTGMLPYDKQQVGRIPLKRLVSMDDILRTVEYIIGNKSLTGCILTLDCGITSKLSVEM